MVVVGKFIVNIILRTVITIIAVSITGAINYIYYKKTNKKFTFAKFVCIFSIILLCSLPLYVMPVM